MTAKKAKKTAGRKMPEFSKPSQATLDAFERGAEKLKGVERRTMFGYPSLFLNGNMLACVFQDRIMVRLSETDRALALEISGAKLFEPSPGRPMREYVDFPRATVTDAKAFGDWLRLGVSYVGSLPPKKTKARTK